MIKYSYDPKKDTFTIDKTSFLYLLNQAKKTEKAKSKA